MTGLETRLAAFASGAREARSQLHPNGARVTRSIRFKDVELRQKTGSEDLQFDGYACITEIGFEMYDMFGSFTEIVRKGAFGKTLSESADVAFLVNHEGTTLARTKSNTLKLSEDDTGLHSEASLDPASPAVQVIRSAMDRGDMDEMSMAFRVTRQSWSPDYDQRDILEVNLDKGDVSLVNYGANPYTFAGLRSLKRGTQKRYLAALTELRAGKTLSNDTMDALQEVLDLVASADDDVDDAQVKLSDLMGVANPDKPELDSESNATTYPLSLAIARSKQLARRCA